MCPRQVMTDIPYGDYFKVEMRWEVASADDGAACEVDIFLSLPFRKKTVWKARIEASARDETRKQFQMWIDTAHAHVAQLKPVSPLSFAHWSVRSGAGSLPEALMNLHGLGLDSLYQQ